jgi:hypothetical protein
VAQERRKEAAAVCGHTKRLVHNLLCFGCVKSPYIIHVVNIFGGNSPKKKNVPKSRGFFWESENAKSALWEIHQNQTQTEKVPLGDVIMAYQS